MVQYGCIFHSAKQFVFEERAGAAPFLPQMLAFVLAGLFTGLFCGLLAGLDGVVRFELVMFGAGLYTAWRGYVFTFQYASSSFDRFGYIFMCFMMSTVLVLLLFVIRCSLELGLGVRHRFILFGASGSLLGLLIYGYTSLCFQEDERKHHLGPCSPEGDIDQAKPPSYCDPESNREALVRSFHWVCSWQWWLDVTDWSTATDEELEMMMGKFVTVHNHTLKLIKVCFYSPDDYFYWVPFGGISGRCVGFIHAGEKCTFILRRRGNAASSSRPYKLKIFQPAMFDRELAHYDKVECGQSYAFIDVEGTVKRSPKLSSCVARPRSQSENPLGKLLSDSSEDEVALLRRQTWPEAKTGLVKHSSHDNIESWKAGLVKHASQDSIENLVNRASDNRASSDSLRRCGSQVKRQGLRKAAPDEVVIRNRSCQEIRAMLYHSNDYCCMVPLVGNIIPSLDWILPSMEKRFNPRNTNACEFTLKVYSIGPGAKELTYLTVSRGQTYTFCNSLLS